MRQILIENFTKRQILEWKKYNALDFDLKKFGQVGFWKIFACNPNNQLLVHFTPRKRDILHFWCFFKSMILKWIFSKRRVRFRFNGFWARQICNCEKNNLGVVLNASCFHFKKTKHVSFSVQGFTTNGWPIDVVQLPVVHLVTKSTTNIVVQFSSLK